MSRSVRFVAACTGMLFLASWNSLLADAPKAAPPKAVPPAVEKKAPPATGQFIRVQRDDNKEPRALETAIVRYVPATGQGDLVVDLISVVHIGDRTYYRQLNRHFEQYDALLYELVAPQGTRIPKGGKRDSDNPVAMLQKVMKVVLDLESQTERIDYTKKNFVHADLSPKEMAEAIRERGDTGLTLALSIAADFLRQQNLQEKQKPQGPAREVDFDWTTLLDGDGAVKLKRLMAEQFDGLSPTGGLGNTLHTIVIADRNQAALKVFQKELAKGKKKIGIFYGAGHMPDFDKRLREDFGLKRHSEQWLTAWDLEDNERSILDVLRMFAR